MVQLISFFTANKVDASMKLSQFFAVVLLLAVFLFAIPGVGTFILVLFKKLTNIIIGGILFQIVSQHLQEGEKGGTVLTMQGQNISVRH